MLIRFPMDMFRNFIAKMYKKTCKQDSFKMVSFSSNLDFSKGRVLVSYLKDPFLWKQNDWRFFAHSNNLECVYIVDIFRNFGFDVDIINYDYVNFDRYDYDVVFDINHNLQLISPFLKKNSKKILHVTGSYPFVKNRSEIARVDALEKRRGCFYTPKLLNMSPELFDRSLNIADACSLIGNDVTLSTFPNKFRKKMGLVTVTGSCLLDVKKPQEYVPNEREFLWFFGGGAVHKGLDLVLEVFYKNRDIKLNVIGRVDSEKDFLRIYRCELNDFPNIFNHGFLHVRNKKFIDITKKVFCFIAPSCSEGISPAVVTCLQLGLYPIISRQTGVTLPRGCGIYLETCSIEEIEGKVLMIKNEKKEILREQIKVIQEYALREYSRDNFIDIMKKFLKKAIFDEK
jgi:hypothetical protein